MKIEIYTVSELQESLSSSSFRSSDTLTVSPERVLSYQNNPRAEDSMPVLFILRENNKILAYRTLLPDGLNTSKSPTSFAWLSGNYVHPDHRRQGLSTQLFNAVNEAWSGKLMYTNYAPASKAVYDKTGDFKCFSERSGKRYYMRSSLASQFKNRLKADKLLSFGDSILNGIHDGRISKENYPLPDDITIEQIDSLDDETIQIIQQTQINSLFNRCEPEFDWIQCFPWVTTNPVELPNTSYQFTRKVSKFESKWFKMKSKDGSAFLWLTHVNDKTSVPYFFSNDQMLVLAARQIVLNEMFENHSAHITIHHQELGPVLGTRMNPFLLARSMPQSYFAHKKLLADIPEGKVIHDGDGDCVFT